MLLGIAIESLSQEFEIRQAGRHFVAIVADISTFISPIIESLQSNVPLENAW